MLLNNYFPHKFFLSVLFLSIIGACSSKTDSIIITESEPIRYLALGDSYTIGTGINIENNYPNQLADSLILRGYNFDTTAVIAANGWTTADLKNGIQLEEPESNYDLVSLLIGVNNQYQGLDIEYYRTEFKELLDQAIEFAGKDTARVFIISIPNYGVTPFGQSREPNNIRKEINSYNDIAKIIAADYNVPLVNVTSISELAADDTTLLASDNLHPSAKMYSLWIEEMLPTVITLLDHEK